MTSLSSPSPLPPPPPSSQQMRPIRRDNCAFILKSTHDHRMGIQISMGVNVGCVHSITLYSGIMSTTPWFSGESVLSELRRINYWHKAGNYFRIEIIIRRSIICQLISSTIIILHRCMHEIRAQRDVTRHSFHSFDSLLCTFPIWICLLHYKFYLFTSNEFMCSLSTI